MDTTEYAVVGRVGGVYSTADIEANLPLSIVAGTSVEGVCSDSVRRSAFGGRLSSPR